MLNALQKSLSAWGITLSDNALLLLLLLIAVLLGVLVGIALNTEKSRRRVLASEAAHQAQRRQEQDLVDDQLDRMQHQFANLAQQALNANNSTFMNLAQQQFRQLTQSASSEFKLRHQGFENLLEPIRTSLQKTEHQLTKIDALRLASETKLEEQIKQVLGSHQELHTQTRNLVTALRRPEVRGQWGELTLKRLVEMAGMSQFCDFTEQPSVRTDDALLRPDMVINLPNNRSIVVDVKTPLDAYLSAHESSDVREQQRFTKQHASNVRKRIVELSRKKYWEQFAGSADFVLLFIPGDQFLNAALDADPSLLEYAIENKALLTTPTSLIGLLKTIAYGWQNDTLSRNTTEIRQTGDTLLKRLNILEKHLGKLGRNLDQSLEQFNRALGSFNRNLKPTAQKLNELGIGQARDADELNDKSSDNSNENSNDKQDAS